MPVKKLVGILAVLLMVAGCGIPGFSSSTQASQDVSVAAAYKCALLTDEALSSHKTVTGSYDCLSKGIQKNLNAQGYGSDAGLASLSQGFTEFTIQSCNTYYKPDATHYAFLFSSTSVVTSDGTPIPGEFVNLDLIYVNVKTGKVDNLQIAGQNPNFDVPTIQNPTCTTSIAWPKPSYVD